MFITICNHCAERPPARRANIHETTNPGHHISIWDGSSLIPRELAGPQDQPANAHTAKAAPLTAIATTTEGGRVYRITTLGREADVEAYDGSEGH